MLIAQRPGLTEEQVEEFRSRFVIEPLEPGFGYTIGNSIRRTLLSSIPGAAVTSIRIEGVLHEFSTVPGVIEDVTDIILNLKELVVSSEHDEPVHMYLRKQGPGPVTAADIAPPAGMEVHNPELHIATLNSKGKLEMELTVERGRGYVSAAQNKQQGQEIGRIPIDSIYSPWCCGVTYKVRRRPEVEQRTDFDKLIVDVETKPCLRPRDAVASSLGKTLVELFGSGQGAQPGRGGHRHRPVADGRGPGGGPGAADRGAQSHCSLLQLPQARGHSHRRRTRRAQRAGSAGHPQLRRQVDRGSQAEAQRHGPGAQGLPARIRPGLGGRQLRGRRR